jgi:hypothetical protein
LREGEVFVQLVFSSHEKNQPSSACKVYFFLTAPKSNSRVYSVNFWSVFVGCVSLVMLQDLMVMLQVW